MCQRRAHRPRRRNRRTVRAPPSVWREHRCATFSFCLPPVNGWPIDVTDRAAARHRREYAGDFEEGDDMTEPTTAVITPAAALARHIEWLEFALAAARSEETWRAGRLEKATKKSRDKRALRLAEVRDEIAELTALIDGIRGLRAGATSRSTSTSTRRRAAARPAAGARKRPSSASKPRSSATTPAAAATSAPTATATPAATAGSGKVAPVASATAKRSTANRSTAKASTVKSATRKPAATPRRRSTAAKPAGSTTPRRRASRPAADGPA